MPVKIVIVDDHEIVREGIRTLIARSRPGWNIAGEASGGAEAIDICKKLKPDVLILDITMPGMSGLEAALRIAELELSCRVLMFTMHESERLVAEVRQAGAQGLVLKSQAARDLIRAIECLLAGGTFFAGNLILKKILRQAYRLRVLEPNNLLGITEAYACEPFRRAYSFSPDPNQSRRNSNMVPEL